MYKVSAELLEKIKTSLKILSDQNNRFLITEVEIREARELIDLISKNYYV
jgi:hypothetical protein